MKEWPIAPGTACDQEDLDFDTLSKSRSFKKNYIPPTSAGSEDFVMKNLSPPPETHVADSCDDVSHLKRGLTLFIPPTIPPGKASEKQASSPEARQDTQPVAPLAATGSTTNREQLLRILLPDMMDSLVFCSGEPFIRDEKRRNLFHPRSMKQLLVWLRGRLNLENRILFSARDFTDVVASVQPDLELGSEEVVFNAFPHLVNCRNGVIDISGGVPHMVADKPDVRFTYCVDAEFLEDTYPEIPPTLYNFWQTSLQGNKAHLDMLLEFIGYALSDTVKGKVIMLLVGKPNTGKSIICNFLQKLLPEEAVTTFSLHQISDRFSGQSLCRAKLNVSSEIEAKTLKLSAMLKACSGGGDRVAADRKFRDAQFMTVRTKLLCAGNAMPQLETGDPSDAIFERLVILPFSQQVERKDPQLLSNLLDERNEIFTHAMFALAKLVSNNFTFSWSEEAKETLDNFRVSANSMTEFCNDMLEFGSGSNFVIGCLELYLMYQRYCKETDLEPLHKTQFISFLLAKGVTRKTIYRNNQQLRAYCGVKFK